MDVKESSNFKAMIKGEKYNSFDSNFHIIQGQCRDLCKEYNQLKSDEVFNTDKGVEILTKILGSIKGRPLVAQNITFDFGVNIHIGERFFSNFNLTILDSCPVTIGDHVLIGPNTSIYTVSHPMNAGQRHTSKYLQGKPVTIGNQVWIGGNVVILPGVVIGDNCVIGAGSVVTKSFGPNSVIGGNPAKVIRIVDQDEAYDKEWENEFQESKMNQ